MEVPTYNNSFHIGCIQELSNGPEFEALNAMAQETESLSRNPTRILKIWSVRNSVPGDREQIVLFHGTEQHNIVPILRNGFRINPRSLADYGPAVYATKALHHAAYYTKSKEGYVLGLGFEFSGTKIKESHM